MFLHMKIELKSSSLHVFVYVMSFQRLRVLRLVDIHAHYPRLDLAIGHESGVDGQPHLLQSGK